LDTWKYFSNHFTETVEKDGVRNDKITLHSLTKISRPRKVKDLSILINSVELYRILSGVLGKGLGIGTRKSPPIVGGDPVRVGRGTAINILNFPIGNFVSFVLTVGSLTPVLRITVAYTVILFDTEEFHV
jgi:hypothetical protein